MIHTNAARFKENIFDILKSTIKYHEPVNISTDEGNAVLLNEEEYNGLIATLELCAEPGLKAKLIEGKNTPLSECLDESEVDL